MRRILLLGSLLLSVSACAVPERVSLQPLPENGPPLPYAELLTRARIQATGATEAFYVNKWSEVEDAARGLEQTARYLPKSEDVPPTQKENLTAICTGMGTDATKLREAAKAQNEKAANETLQRLNLAIRELRLNK
jgi:hypothetical protein